MIEILLALVVIVLSEILLALIVVVLLEVLLVLTVVVLLEVLLVLIVVVLVGILMALIVVALPIGVPVSDLRLSARVNIAVCCIKGGCIYLAFDQCSLFIAQLF